MGGNKVASCDLTATNGVVHGLAGTLHEDRNDDNDPFRHFGFRDPFENLNLGEELRELMSQGLVASICICLFFRIIKKI